MIIIFSLHHAVLTDELRGEDQLNQTPKSVFIIKNKDESVPTSGSGFFFGNSQTFVTSFNLIERFILSLEDRDKMLHVLSLNIDTTSSKEILSDKWFQDLSIKIQKGIQSLVVTKGQTQYRIKRLIALDIKYDLAILEVEDYTGPALQSTNENLKNRTAAHLFGYSVKDAVIHHQVGQINIKKSNAEQLTMVNDQLNQLIDANGSPVVDLQGRIVGVLVFQQASSNVMFLTPARYLTGLMHHKDEKDALSDIEKIIKTYTEFITYIKQDSDELAKWRFAYFNHFQIPLAMAYKIRHYNTQALPHLNFQQNTFYNPNGLPTNQRLKYKQIISNVIIQPCKQIFRNLSR